jgi:hypothetical protein
LLHTNGLPGFCDYPKRKVHSAGASPESLKGLMRRSEVAHSGAESVAAYGVRGDSGTTSAARATGSKAETTSMPAVEKIQSGRACRWPTGV